MIADSIKKRANATRTVNDLLGNICSLFSQPGEGPILFQPGGSDKHFSQEEKNNARDRPRTAKDGGKISQEKQNCEKS